MEEKIIQELSRLVSIKSESRHEQEILIYLEKRLENLGFSLFRQSVVDDRYNLILSPSLTPKLLFSAHVDTVPDFGYPGMYSPRIENGRLYGRGSVDTKAGIAALIIALELAREKSIDATDFAVVFTVDEEQDGLGSKILPEIIRSEGAVVLEPTELVICTAEAGSIEVRVEIKGTAAHGGDFESGENPILKAVSLVNSFQELKFIHKYHPHIGSGGFNLMEIKGGANALIVPDRCELFVDFRVLPGQDAAEVKSELLDFFIRKDVKAEFVDVDPSFELTEEEPVVRLIERAYRTALGETPRLGGIKSWTDAANLIAGGIPSIIFGPGKLSVAHTAWENVEIHEVAAAAKVLYRLILEVSGASGSV